MDLKTGVLMAMLVGIAMIGFITSASAMTGEDAVSDAPMIMDGYSYSSDYAPGVGSAEPEGGVCICCCGVCGCVFW